MTYSKYHFTGKTCKFKGRTLHQIECDEYGVGGWIESERNLSPFGDCWVFDDAKVYDDARVYDNAKIYGDANRQTSPLCGRI